MNYVNTKIVKSDDQWLIIYSEAFQKNFLHEVKELCDYIAQAYNKNEVQVVKFDFSNTKTLKVTDLIYLIETLLLLGKSSLDKLKISIIKYKPLMDLAKLYDLSNIVDKYLVE